MEIRTEGIKAIHEARFEETLFERQQIRYWGIHHSFLVSMEVEVHSFMSFRGLVLES